MIPFILEIAGVKKAKEGRKALRNQLFVEKGGRCCYCHKKISIKRATLEHLRPTCLGGTDDISNLDIACSDCNNELGGIVGSLKQWYVAEKKIKEIEFRRSFFGRVLHVFWPNFEYDDIEEWKIKAEQAHKGLHTQMVKFKNYKCFYSRYLDGAC